MSLTVVKRPPYVTLLPGSVSTAVTDASGDALFTSVAHGLSTGNYIYVTTTALQYNGFWYVQVIDPDTFKIREYATADFVGFISAVSGSFLTSESSAATSWVCVHLPVIYKLQSNIWPINGADTARTVTSFSNYNGYTALNLSGDIKATGTASALEQVIIDGTSSLDGTYKILNWFSDSSIVINLAYSASHSFGGTVQYYYFNYHAIIRVFAGLQTGHTWDGIKPIEQVAEIKCLPDSTGLITVNISDFLKKKIGILNNNLLLETLPNNIDAFCEFYISHAESYDDSDGYSVEQFTSSFTDDSGSYLGRAVNAKLPFKDRYINMLNEYIYSSTTQGAFLTASTTPRIFPGKYFDLSFLVGQLGGNMTARRRVYIDDVLKEEFLDTIIYSSPGVYRYSFDQSGWGEDEIRVAIFVGAVQLTEEISVDVQTECASQSEYITWLNNVGGYDYWDFTAKKTSFITNLESQTQEKNIFTNFPNSNGEFADTIRQQTVRRSRNAVRIESQNLTQAQLDGIKWIFSSPLVQIVDSIYDRRTIIVDAQSVEVYKDQQDLFTIGFNASYTDELPSQSL